MMDWSARCYISFVEICPPVPEQIFEGFLHYYYWLGGHIGHVVIKNFFLYLKAFIQNLVENGPVVSEKSKFQFSNVNDLDPAYSHTFIHSIRCLHLPTFWSQAAIVSEKIHC